MESLRVQELVRRRESSEVDPEGSITSHPSQSADDSKSNSYVRRLLVREVSKLESQSPFVRKVFDVVRTLPPLVRIVLICLWLLWKVFVTLLMVRLTFSNTLPTFGGAINREQVPFSRKTKILYIVTTLAEYNNGMRKTVKGQDRLAEVLIPVLVDSVESMISVPYNYNVDVYLILGYTLTLERRQMISDRLPAGVGFQVWDDAAPLGYDARKSGNEDHLVENTRALARQHRYVIRDKLYEYDFFIAMEDDMRYTGAHVHSFLELSVELESVMKSAPESLPVVPESSDPKKMRFFGDMTKGQLKRLIPGYVRVEVLLNETLWWAQKTLDPIKLDFDYNGEKHIDPSICCSIPNMRPIKDTPVHPDHNDIVIWETSVKGLSVRQLPNSEEWVILLPGPGKKLRDNELIGGYWSGRDGAFGEIPKPGGGQPDLIAQQGGWVATRDQILRFDEELCMGKFLPPFDPPQYNNDGQESMNVEFWSGGYQLFTGVKNGCNLQRVLRFDPDHFSKHLIYHVANNKQKQLPSERMLRADNLFAQLNSVRKNAIKAKAEMDLTGK